MAFAKPYCKPSTNLSFKDYDNLDFLAPLVNAMTQTDPSARPTIDAALRQFHDILSKQPARSLRRLILYRDADKIDKFFRDVGTFRREAGFIIKSYFRV